MQNNGDLAGLFGGLAEQYASPLEGVGSEGAGPSIIGLQGPSTSITQVGGMCFARGFSSGWQLCQFELSWMC